MIRTIKEPAKRNRIVRTIPPPTREMKVYDSDDYKIREAKRTAVRFPYMAIAELCRRSFFRFMQEFWECVSSDKPKWNWHIAFLCKELEYIAYRVGDGLPKEHDLVINIPPGSTKSITCTIMFPVWCWTKWYWMRFIAASYSGPLALEQAEYSRDLIRSEKFKKIFPELEVKEDKDTKSNFRIVKIDERGNKLSGGNRFSTSVGGTLTGYHAHILIVDDPLNPHEAASEVKLERANTWMSQTLPTRKTDKEVTPTILIQQRLHQADPTGTMLEQKRKNIKHICLPGEIRNYRKYVKPKEVVENYVDDLLDPKRLSWGVLEELEAELGQYGYAGQIGQNPTPPGGGMFKVDNFVVVDSIMDNLIEYTIRYWDKAASQDEGDFTAGVKMAKLKDGRYAVLHVEHGQWSTNIREDTIKQTAESDGTKVKVGIEVEPGASGKSDAQATVKNLAGFSAFTDRPSGDKVIRADPYSVQVNHGNVILLKGAWNKKYIDELRYFPFGAHDDMVDASAGAFNVLSGKKKAGLLFKKRSKEEREKRDRKIARKRLRMRTV